MTCGSHLWLPERGRIWRNVVCGRCRERRHVAFKWARPEPRTCAEALIEAIDRGVIGNTEVLWGGARLR